MIAIQRVIDNDKERREETKRRIERLVLDGHSDHDISVQMNLVRRIVGRHRRELWREWLAAAAESPERHRAATIARHAAIYREAMKAWRLSQDERLVTTIETKSGDEVVKTTTRREAQPGDRAFLTTAQIALKTIELLRTPAAAPDAVSPDGGPANYLSLRPLCNSDEVSDELLEQIVDQEKADHAANGASRASLPSGGAELAGIHDVDQARLPRELAPQGPGGIAPAGGNGRL